jgi:hypothetical protein
MSHEVLYVNYCHSLNRTILRHEITEIIKSINVTRKSLRRIYCRCTRIFHKISSNYAPLQAVIKFFEINYTFSSILILVASIYCKKRSRAEKRDCWKFFVSFQTKRKIFRSKVQRSNISQNSKYFICLIWTYYKLFRLHGLEI